MSDGSSDQEWTRLCLRLRHFPKSSGNGKRHVGEKAVNIALQGARAKCHLKKADKNYICVLNNKIYDGLCCKLVYAKFKS